MINKNKTHRLMIQVSINQYNWLLQKSNQLEISISQLVRWLLNKKIKDINDIKKLENQPKKAIEEINEEEWKKAIDEIENIHPNKINKESDLPF